MSVRIMHGVVNIAGIPGNLARAERAIGCDSISLCHPDAYGYGADRALGRKPPEEELTAALAAFDVFNLHFGRGFFGQDLSDHDRIKAAGKKVHLFFHGCDVRQAKKVIARHAVGGCHVCWPAACNANSRRLIDWAARHADAVLVSTPDLIEFVPGAQWLPQALDMQAIAALPPPAAARDVVRVLHAPTAPALKGTAQIMAALEALRAQGAPIEPVMVQASTHAAVLAAMAGADLVIDQCLMGIYGMVAVEAMALGKPVMAYIRDDLRAHYPADLPVIALRPGTVEDDIRTALAARAGWPALGAAGRQYVARHHAADVIARRLADLYR